MALASVASRALAGIDAPEVTVEVHLGPGLPAFHIVGLPDAQVLGIGQAAIVKF